MLLTNNRHMEPSKADRTRERLQRIALDLFLAHGFEQATVAQIADAAGVSQMTFFRHFATKDATVLDDPFDPAIGAAVAAQPADLRPLDRLCRGFALAIASLDPPVEEQTRRRLAVVADTPSLRASIWRNTEATQAVIVEALRAGGASPMDADVAAGACLGALTAALLAWGRDDGTSSMSDVLLRGLDLVSPGCLGRARGNAEEVAR